MLKHIVSLLLVAVLTGWVPSGESGYAWTYKNQDGYTVGSCYMVPSKAGKKNWLGKFYGYRTDFKPYSFPERNHESLADCVHWVEHQLHGGYYL